MADTPTKPNQRRPPLSQEYDYHLAAVNTITFVDEGRRFVSTSDDKTIRVWDLGVPVQVRRPACPLTPGSQLLLWQHTSYLACHDLLSIYLLLTQKGLQPGEMIEQDACSSGGQPEAAQGKGAFLLQSLVWGPASVLVGPRRGPVAFLLATREVGRSAMSTHLCTARDLGMW